MSVAAKEAAGDAWESNALGYYFYAPVAVSDLRALLIVSAVGAVVNVASALLVDQMNAEGMTMWLHMNKEEAGLPLHKEKELYHGNILGGFLRLTQLL